MADGIPVTPPGASPVYTPGASPVQAPYQTPQVELEGRAMRSVDVVPVLSPEQARQVKAVPVVTEIGTAGGGKPPVQPTIAPGGGQGGGPFPWQGGDVRSSHTVKGVPIEDVGKKLRSIDFHVATAAAPSTFSTAMPTEASAINDMEKFWFRREQGHKWQYDPKNIRVLGSTDINGRRVVHLELPSRPKSWFTLKPYGGDPLLLYQSSGRAGKAAAGYPAGSWFSLPGFRHPESELRKPNPKPNWFIKSSSTMGHSQLPYHATGSSREASHINKYLQAHGISNFQVGSSKDAWVKHLKMIGKVAGASLGAVDVLTEGFRYGKYDPATNQLLPGEYHQSESVGENLLIGTVYSLPKSTAVHRSILSHDKALKKEGWIQAPWKNPGWFLSPGGVLAAGGTAVEIPLREAQNIGQKIHNWWVSE